MAVGRVRVTQTIPAAAAARATASCVILSFFINTLLLLQWMEFRLIVIILYHELAIKQ